ncbi:MAG: S-adenosylmethionine:tRNA ribosyltransferase-isomerase [Thermoplasmata archaeon]|nr:S-adenosylmethionine:tRNA ribosyltransferase-isomerase [Thermoplasmata archaeon]
MIAPVLDFARPIELQATGPPELRGIDRDGVRLLVSQGMRTAHHRFVDLPELLHPGDLLVINRSATLPASLPAEAEFGEFRLSLSTHYGGGLWVAEPRWSAHRPGPVPLPDGASFRLAGLSARRIAGFPGIARLAFVRIAGDLPAAMGQFGEPIHYRYVPHPLPLEAYQTAFSAVPGSAEMPSAGRPFTARLLREITRRGVGIAPLVLHAGVSSLGYSDAAGTPPIYPEPFEVPATTAAAVNRARSRGRRVIAVGTTVLRALESAREGAEVRAARGFTRAYIHPGRGAPSVDGLITGWHDPGTSHLALLETIAGRPALSNAYQEAVEAGYLWHEFGDSHLLLRE